MLACVFVAVELCAYAPSCVLFVLCFVSITREYAVVRIVHAGMVAWWRLLQIVSNVVVSCLRSESLHDVDMWRMHSCSVA